MEIGQTVKFGQGDEANTQLTGTISRIWPGGKTVTIKTPGRIAGTVRTFVRDITSVEPALQAGDYVVFKPQGPEAPMKITEVGAGWVELEQGISLFRVEMMLVTPVA